MTKQDEPVTALPTVAELDRILRRSLPADVVYAIAPNGDPFTRWARMMLGERAQAAASRDEGHDHGESCPDPCPLFMAEREARRALATGEPT